jgi:FlaG/FlaF family flagellin (archaellin)
VSPVVGVAVLVGITVVLAAVTGGFVAFGVATTETAPQASVAATADATDGWPDGQRLRLTHRAGDPLVVADLALVVTVDRGDVHARLTGFPTRRLTADNARGTDVFDSGFAGVDGALDAAHTDGEWTSGETTSVRIAQGDLDLHAGDRIKVRIVHRPTNAVLAREATVAS